MKTLADIKIGDTVRLDGYTGFCDTSDEIVTNVTTGFDDETGLTFNVIHIGNRRFDSWTGKAMNPPIMYYIEPIE